MDEDQLGAFLLLVLIGIIAIAAIFIILSMPIKGSIGGTPIEMPFGAWLLAAAGFGAVAVLVVINYFKSPHRR